MRHLTVECPLWVVSRHWVRGGIRPLGTSALERKADIPVKIRDIRLRTAGFGPKAAISGDGHPRPAEQLDFRLLRNLKSVLDLDTEIPDGTFQFSMTQEQLDRSQIFGALINKGCLGSAH